jgi:hypothetical protein
MKVGLTDEKRTNNKQIEIKGGTNDCSLDVDAVLSVGIRFGCDGAY